MAIDVITDIKLSEYYVQPLEKEKALNALKDRMKNGENPYEIIKVDDKYYGDKIISGLCPISALIYMRIMNELPLQKPEPDVRYCFRCGAIVKGKGLYCYKCSDKYKRSLKADDADTLPYIRPRIKKGSHIQNEF